MYLDKPGEKVICKSIHSISQVVMCFSGTKIKKSRDLGHFDTNKRVKCIIALYREDACTFLKSGECIGCSMRMPQMHIEEGVNPSIQKCPTSRFPSQGIEFKF